MTVTSTPPVATNQTDLPPNRNDGVVVRHSNAHAVHEAQVPYHIGGPSSEATAKTVRFEPAFHHHTLQQIAQAVARCVSDPNAAEQVRALVGQAGTHEPGYARPEATQLVVQTLRSRCPLGVKVAVLHLPGFDLHAAVQAEGRAMVDAAAACNDNALVSKLLSAGAPYVRPPPQADMHTRRVLAAELAISKLYPAPPSHDATPLDKALRARDFEQAGRLLEEEREGRSDSDLWRHAVSSDREDIRRAMLVLCDHTPGPGSMASVMHKDGFTTSSPALKNFLKSIPYYSPKRQVVTDDPAYMGVDPSPRTLRMFDLFGGFPVDNSMKETFDDGTPISCQSIVPVWTDGLDSEGKFDYSKFATPQAVKRNVTSHMRMMPSDRMAMSARVTLTPSDEWGGRLADEFRDMESKDQGKRVLECYSRNNVWGTVLRVKKASGGFETKYVVKVFDAAVTTGPKRAASVGSLDAIELLPLAQLTPTEVHHELMFGTDDAPLILAFDPPAQGWENLPARSPYGDIRRRLSDPWEGPVTTSLLSRLMWAGLEGELSNLERKIIQHVSTLLPQEAKDFLMAKQGMDRTCLASALLARNLGTAQWYCELLGQLDLTPEVLCALLTQVIPIGDGRRAGILWLLFQTPRLHESAIVYMSHAVPLLDGGDVGTALLASREDGHAAVFSLLTDANDDLLELYAATLQALGVSADAISMALTAGGCPEDPELPWICILAVHSPGTGHAFAEFVHGLGLTQNQRLLDMLAAVSKVQDDAAEIGAFACVQPAVIETRLRTQVQNAVTMEPWLRQQVMQGLLSTLDDQGELWSESDILAVAQTSTETVAIKLQAATHAMLKYQRFVPKQAMLIQALQKFNDPSTQIYSNGDSGYFFEIDLTHHGRCTVEFRVDRNLVPYLRLCKDDTTLVSMRDCDHIWSRDDADDEAMEDDVPSDDDLQS